MTPQPVNGAYRYLWQLVILALVLRLGFVLGYEQYPLFLGDDGSYDNVGQNLANGRGFVWQTGDPVNGFVYEPMVGPGPTYPIFLGLTYFLFGHSVTAVRVIQALLGGATVILMFLIAGAVFGEQVARISGFLTAIHPALISYSGMLLTETLFAFLIAVSIWAMILAIKSRTPKAWILVGIISGLMVLLRSEALLIVILGSVLVLWYGEKRHKMRNLLIFAMFFVLTISVWTVRNYIVFNEIILVSSDSGRVLWISTVGWSEWHFDDERYTSLLLQGLNGREADRVLQREGLKNILGDPVHYLRLCFERIIPFWIGSHTLYIAGFSDSFQAYYARGAHAQLFVKGTILLLNTSLIVLAFGGALASLLNKRDERYLRGICLNPIVAIATVHFFLFATSRYQVPILPFILMFSVVGMVKASNYFRSRSVLGC